MRRDAIVPAFARPRPQVAHGLDVVEADPAELDGLPQDYIDAHNDRAKPFHWTKTAHELLAKIKRKPINNTRH